MTCLPEERGGSFFKFGKLRLFIACFLQEQGADFPWGELTPRLVDIWISLNFLGRHDVRRLFVVMDSLLLKVLFQRLERLVILLVPIEGFMVIPWSFFFSWIR